MNRLAVVILSMLIPCAIRISNAATSNIALHKPYTFSLAPNNSACTDAGDATQLTDGIRVDKGVFWEQKESVGWNYIHGPISITIDLGQDQPIDGLSFRTAATGAYGFPTSLAIAVSMDGRTFHMVGDLVRLEESWLVKDGNYAVHDYRTTKLRTHGRYVRVTGVSSSLTLFCDEIEVYRGDDAWLEQPVTGEVLTDEQLADPLRLTRLGVFRRICSDWVQVRAAVEKEAPTSAKPRLLAELDALKPEIETEQYPDSLEGFKAILPVGPLDAKILAIHGKLLAAGGAQPLTLWHTPPYELLEGPQSPKPGMSDLDVRMMGNEHRAETFNLTNASGEPRTVKFTISGLPADAGLNVYEVEMVDNRLGWPTASALVQLKPEGEHFVTVVPAGMTRQIWLSFDSSNAPAGNHLGRISLSSDSFNRTIPLRLYVAPVRMADHMALNSGMWDYIYPKYYGVSSGNQDAAARDMSDHLINTVWSTANSAPFPRGTDFDTQGNLTGRIDYSQWDDFVNFWRARNRNITHFCLSVGLNSGEVGGFKPNTPQFERAVGQWAADWAAHNRRIGLKPKQAMIVFIDEPNQSSFRILENLSKAFKSLTQDVGIITNPLIHTLEEAQAARPMFELADLIVPTLGVYGANPPEVKAVYQQLRRQGKELGFYMCTTPVLHFDASYYRLQPWRAFAAGATFSGFWAYGDNGRLADSWNPYTAIGASNYTPVFLSPTGVSGSKHWEALREGIEDYQYLYMLAQKRGRAAAEAHVHQAIDELVETNPGYYGTRSNAGRLAESARLAILSELAR